MKKLTNLDILKLFKKELGISATRTGVYWYIVKHKFPKPIPTRQSYNRVWNEARVMKWFKQFRKTRV